MNINLSLHVCAINMYRAVCIKRNGNRVLGLGIGFFFLIKGGSLVPIYIKVLARSSETGGKYLPIFLLEIVASAIIRNGFSIGSPATDKFELNTP